MKTIMSKTVAMMAFVVLITCVVILAVPVAPVQAQLAAEQPVS